MLQAKFNEELIVTAISESAKPAAFDTAITSLLSVKQAGASDKILAAMISAASTSPSQSANTGSGAVSPFPEDVGVYMKGGKGRDPNQWNEIVPEVVNFRTGGMLKAMATSGLAGGHLNGAVQNPRSRTQVSPPLEILIRCAEGTSPAEYQLLRLDEKKDRREFRAVTGGVVGGSTGAGKNKLEFAFDKIASRTYRVSLPNMAKGEYGFLPPGMTSMSAASGGKLYTFGIE